MADTRDDGPQNGPARGSWTGKEDHARAFRADEGKA